MKYQDILPAQFSTIGEEIKEKGFAFRSGKEIGAAMKDLGVDLDGHQFASSWDDLGLDLCMADGGRYRRRRFAAFRLLDNFISRKPHQPHYQSQDYNTLNGGIQRCFDPVLEEVANHSFMQELIGICGRVFDRISPDPARSSPWHTEVHQFRIETRNKESGLPTPEGMHRDGVEWVCVALINRENVTSGVTKILDTENGSLSQFILTHRLDAVFLDDRRVLHGVTPISFANPEHHGFRDVLVLTFRHDADKALAQ